MKKLLIFVLACVLFMVSCACAESAVCECDYFTAVLPEGIEPLEDSAGYEAAAAADYGNTIETVLAAADPANISLVTVSVIGSDESADLAASNASEILLGSNSTVASATYGEHLCSQFSCSVDSVNYDFYYLSDGAHIYCVTFTGLTPEEEQAFIASIAFK